MMRLTSLAVLLVTLAGCAGEGSPAAALDDVLREPVEHTLLDNVGKAIGADEYFYVEFDMSHDGVGAYALQARDDSTMNIGFIQAEDFAELRTGEQVAIWAYNEEVNSARGSAEMPAGSYMLVVHCLNTFADCDVTLDASATY